MEEILKYYEYKNRILYIYIIINVKNKYNLFKYISSDIDRLDVKYESPCITYKIKYESCNL